MSEFKNRVYGVVIVKAINSNYNADFTHQPRTLPDGVAYATDKALKFTIRHYLLKHYPSEKIFYYKRMNENLNPYDLDEAYTKMFSEIKDHDPKTSVLTNLLSALDVRLFGATFANKKKKLAISIHGPIQICHGVSRFYENGKQTSTIFSEQIMSPFRDDKKEKEGEYTEKEASTLGSQSKLKEGHYVHHFTVNPKNLESHSSTKLSSDDIAKLKEAMRSGATYYDSASKAGTENELLLWVQLNENSKLVLPSFTERIKVTRKDDKADIDLTEVGTVLAGHEKEIQGIELYFNSTTTKVTNPPKGASEHKL